MRLLAVDANSILNRAFYGVRPLTTKNGEHTNAVYGFMNMLLKILNDYKVDAVAFAFDLPGPTFRHDLSDDYKGTRKPMPDELAEQLPLIRELLTALGYRLIELPGYEADDILGTLSSCCEAAGWDCLIATGDRDAFQLIGGRTKVLYASTRAGQSETVLYDDDSVAERYGGLTPHALIDLKALMGDSSDNIPGVPGVGEKTALMLLERFGSLDAIYQDLDSLDVRPTLRERLRSGKEAAYLSRELGTIRRDLPLDCRLEDLHPKAPDTAQAYRLLSRLEMFRLIERLNLPAPEGEDPEPDAPDAPEAPALKAADAQALLQAEGPADMLVDFEGGSPARLLLRRGEGYTEAEGEQATALLDALLKACVPLRIHGGKALYKYALPRDLHPHVALDLELAAYLINPNASDYALERLAAEYGLPTFAPGTEGELMRFSALCDLLWARILADGQGHLLTQIEQPLCEVLADMELRGFCLDSEGLKAFGDELSKEIEALTARIYALSEGEFNLNSPKQLGEVLFDRLGLPPGKKTKTGYSTSADVLENLRDKHPIVELILSYRKLIKLQSTYVTGLLAQVEADGRVRTQFRQTETRTGRISSVEPNLQNIPIRTEIGSRLRRFFGASPGHLLVDADYSQIELRVLAHIADDATMIEAFKQGEDIHTITASQVFGLPLSFVTPQMRNRAKAVNFGIVYGIGAFSLSRDIGVSVSEADAYIKGYLAHYPGVRQYMEDTIAFAKKEGYVKTLFGRRRAMPELTSSNYNTRSFGERVAMNTPIQGSAADIIKLAMVRVYNRLKKEGLKSRLILQVHDELIVEAPESEAEQVSAILRQEMENAALLQVPLTVDVHMGTNWLEAK